MFKKLRIIDIMMILSFYLFSLHDVLSGSIYLIVGSVLTLPYYRIIFNEKHSEANLLLLLVLFSFFFGSIINLLVTDNGLGGSLIIIATISLGHYCLHNLEKIEIHVLIVVLYFIIYIVYGLQSVDFVANNIYEEQGLSRNHPGFMLILWIAFYSFVRKVQGKRYLITIPIIAAGIGVFLEGRSSMALLILMAIVMIIEYNKKVSIIILIVIVFLVMYNWHSIMGVYELTSFYEHGTESSRFDIWKAYFENMRFEWLICGVDTMAIPIIAEKAGNPHNAFINMHARLGLFATICFFYVLIVSVNSYIKQRRFMCLFFLIVVLARAFFDSELFISTYDFIPYSMIFYSLYNREFQSVKQRK